MFFKKRFLVTRVQSSLISGNQKSNNKLRKQTLHSIPLLMATIFLLTGCGQKNEKKETTVDDMPARFSELQKIVTRAKEIVQYIDDTGTRALVKTALDSIAIVAAHKGQFVLPTGKMFSMVSVTRAEMGYEAKDSNNTIVMQFLPQILYENGKVVVEVDRCVDTFSNDIDVKATTLIHEIKHAVQYLHLYQSGKTFQQIFEDVPLRCRLENEAWDMQMRLFMKIRPELFKGLSADCEQSNLLNVVTPEQKLLLTNGSADRMLYGLALYYTCGEPLIKKLYGIKYQN